MSVSSRLTYKGIRLSLFSLNESSCRPKHRPFWKLNHKRKLSSRSSIYPENEYTSKPIYPPIMNLSQEADYKRTRDKQLDKIKQVGTVEEKLIGINMPRYYGWSSIMLKEGNFPFNFLPFVQHITRTDLIEVKKFPFSNNLSQSEIECIAQNIKPQLQEAIVLEITKRWHPHMLDGRAEQMGEGQLSDEVTKGVVEQINRIISTNLVQHAPHLYETEIDFEPRIEAFWRVGGFYPDNKTYEERKKDIEDHKKELKTNRHAKRKIKEEPEDLVGHFIQYVGHPILQLRSNKPLRPLDPSVLSSVAEEGSSPVSPRQPDPSEVPFLRYDPGFYGLEKIRRYGTNIPGFWPGDPNQFGLLSFHSCGHLLDRPSSFGDMDAHHTLASQAILAGYAWLLAQANYQGFSTFHELTYPLTTTTVITNGKEFSFFASQLNTLLLHDEFIDINPQVNVCYSLPTHQLFQKIEGNEIIGWDDRALQLLVEAYLNAPAERKGVDMQPYVDKAVPLVQNIDHEERRVWLHEVYRHLFANRPRHRLDPEIYDWEMIYKIKFPTRPLDARRRFFELDIDPFKRRLDDRKKKYIPRKLRDPENPKKKSRDQFWPDC